MKTNAWTRGLLVTLCLLLCLPCTLGETRQGVIALEGQEEPIEETLFASLQGFTLWYAADRLDAYEGEMAGLEGLVVECLDTCGYMVLEIIPEEDAVDYARDFDFDIVKVSAQSRVQKDVYRVVEDGQILFLTVIAENGQYLSAVGGYSLEVAEGNGKYMDRVLDSVSLFSEYDMDMLRSLPGEWTYTGYIEEQDTDQETPTADLALLTLGEGGWAALDCYDTKGEYLSVWGATWYYKPVPEYGGELTLEFNWTDDPDYGDEDMNDFRLECVWAAYTESWIENDTLITYLILNPEIRSSGVSPFEAYYDDPIPALHKDQGPNMRVVNCKEFVSLRETRSTSAKRLAKIPLGALVLAFPEYGEENGFIYCVYHDEEGYILAEYLEAIELPEDRW